MNPTKVATTMAEQIDRAVIISRSLSGGRGADVSRTGAYFAGKYLIARGWSIDAAMMILVGPAACERIRDKEAIK